MCDSLVSKDHVLIVYCPDKYIAQKMCNKAVDDSPVALELIHDWFATSKIIFTSKIFLLLCMHMKIYSTLTKILVMLHFLVMKWVF